MATRNVAAHHVGEMEYPNHGDWGQWSYDQATGAKFGFRSINGVKDEQGQAAEYASSRYADVPGWLTDEEGACLARLARGLDVLEIGSYCGRSTIWLASTARVVHAVDTFDGRATPTPGNTFGTFDAALRKHGVRDKVEAWIGTSEHIVPTIPGVHLAFIDGGHDYESVKRDIDLACDALLPGGLLAFHDYMRPQDPGVTKAVDELVYQGGVIEQITGSVAVVQPPSAYYNLDPRPLWDDSKLISV